MQGPIHASLSATDLACRRGDRLLFRRLTLNLSAGQALHVTGANGIGKSSLLRILGGLLRPFAGTVERHGAAGLIDERPALDEHLPLGRALGFWERIDGCSDPAMPLAAMDLGPLTAVPVRFLSTGQRKRAAFARLLNQGAAAPIWLLDEPLNGLDDSARAKVEGLIALHCGGGGICVLASHQALAVPGIRVLDLAEYAA